MKVAPGETVMHYFPAGLAGFLIGVESRRDGDPVGADFGVPVYARYYLMDEFETPIFEYGGQTWFNTAEEVRLAAKAYLGLSDNKHFMPDRFWFGAWAAWFNAARALPDFVLKMRSPKITAAVRAALIEQFVDGTVLK